MENTTKLKDYKHLRNFVYIFSLILTTSTMKLFFNLQVLVGQYFANNKRLSTRLGLNWSTATHKIQKAISNSSVRITKQDPSQVFHILHKRKIIPCCSLRLAHVGVRRCGCLCGARRNPTIHKCKTLGFTRKWKGVVVAFTNKADNSYLHKS